jgi:CRISPR-associated endonuclease/helicase Cas3
MAELSAAALSLSGWEQEFGAAGETVGAGEKVATRLGAADRLASFDDAFPTPFGCRSTALTLPPWWADGADEDARPREVDADVSVGTVRFRFGRRDFVYDRLGLRPQSGEASEGGDA